MQDLAKKLGIEDHSGWNHIDWKIIKENGGECILKQHKSLLHLLQFVFPGFVGDISRNSSRLCLGTRKHEEPTERLLG